MTDNIVTLIENTLLDIPAQLRALADRLESGEDVGSIPTRHSFTKMPAGNGEEPAGITLSGEVRR